MKPHRELLSREDLNNLPLRRYEGEICLVKTEQDARRALEDFANETVAGLDTETRPAFRAGESYLPSLVQIASARTVYLFQLRHQPFIPTISQILENPRLVKAGIGLTQDFFHLHKVFQFEGRNVVDLSKVAKHHGIKQCGVRNLAGRLLALRIGKGAQRSNWAHAHLSEKQIVYAATDAWICRELYLRLEELGMLSRDR
ncbi:MAG: 3'-5' exonuclease domain-containing protein 2 [Verrucomicrobiae bacterium]|nr:3'-5' exonuclease domain-containing protein 2 [Verrucomicrobiae bacterium]